MAEDPATVAGEDPAKGSADPKSVVAPAAKKQRPGFFSRLRGMFGGRSSEDFEKKLQHLSKEEASVVAKLKRRALSSRRMARNIIVLAVVIEVVAVGYAIMTTRSLDLNWQMRAVRVLPMFLLPGVSSLIYTALVRFTRMLDRKDQKTLERLRAERQAKIDELKERTNYYTTQQLIQRYDLDPAAKAAAATVLASKLGADSGLRVYLGDDISAESGKSNDAELAQSSGLRNRKSPQLVKSHSTGSAAMAQFIDETAGEEEGSVLEASGQDQRVVEHYKGSDANDGGWMARIAALLVGEDPTQCYALICGNCRMHNGLARKEDFPYVTYYCPHCRALNGSRQPEVGSSSSSGKNTSTPASPGEGNSLATIHELSPEGSEEQEAAVKAG